MKPQAYLDLLTGISNRRLFVESLENRVEQCRQYGDNCAILFLDVDNLKKTNEDHGQAAGDALLVRFAEILKINTRTTDVVARIGGNEFGLLLDHLNGDQVADKIEILIAQLGLEKFVYQGEQLPMSTSISYCFIGPRDTTDALMSRADAAIYRVKDKAK